MNTCKNCGTYFDTNATLVCPFCHITWGKMICTQCESVYTPQTYDQGKCPVCSKKPPSNWNDDDYQPASSSQPQGGQQPGYGFDNSTTKCPKCSNEYKARLSKCPSCGTKKTEEEVCCTVCTQCYTSINGSTCPNPKCNDPNTEIKCKKCGESYPQWMQDCPYCEKETCTNCGKEFVKTAKMPSCRSCRTGPTTCYPSSSAESSGETTCYPSSSGESSGATTAYPSSSDSSEATTGYPSSSADSNEPTIGYPSSSSSSSKSSEATTGYPSSSSENSGATTPYPSSSSSDSSSGTTDYPTYPSSSSSSKSSAPGDPDDPTPVGEGPESDSSCTNSCSDSCSDSCSSSSGCCEGGTMGSVAMNIPFGRFPDYPGMPAGMLTLHSTLIDPTLNTTGAYTYNHITARTIAVNSWNNAPKPTGDTGIADGTGTAGQTDNATPTNNNAQSGTEINTAHGGYTVGVKTPTGNARFSTYTQTNDGKLTTTKEGGNRYRETLIPLNANNQPLQNLQDTPAYFKETLEDGTEIQYDAADGKFSALTLPNGVTMNRAQLKADLHIIKEPDKYTMKSAEGQKVEMNNAAADPRSFTQIQKGRLIQIWNRTDGLLDFTQGSAGYTIRHYLPDHIAGFDQPANRYTLRAAALPVKTWTIATGARVKGKEQIGWNGQTYKTPDYLKFYRVDEESGGTNGVRQTYRWNQLDERTLLFVKGYGATAEMVLKQRIDLSNDRGPSGGREDIGGIIWQQNTATAQKNGSPPAARNAHMEIAQGIADNAYKSNTGQAMGVNGVPSTRIRMITTKYKGETYNEQSYPNSPANTSTEEIYQSYDFGNVIVQKTEGYGTDTPQITKYGYGATGGSQGRCIREHRPDGATVTRTYDDNGRLSAETTPWAGGGTQTTSYTYYNQKHNDQRVHTQTVTITKDGTNTLLTRETYDIEETATERHTTVTRTGLGVDHPRISEQKTSLDNTQPYAKGKITWEKNETGIETWHTYTPVDQTDPARATATWTDLQYKSTTETRIAGQIVPGKSSRQEIWYSPTGKPVHIRQHVHTGETYTPVDQEEREYDYKDRLTRTKSALGTRTTEWSCHGAVTRTDENLVMTQYEYDTTGKPTRQTRHATPHTYQIEGHPIPTASLPSTIMEHTYDGEGHILSNKTTQGEMVKNESRTYDKLGRLICATDAMGKDTDHSYASDGLSETVTLPTGATLVSKYHQDGNLLEESGTGRRSKFYSYTLTGNGIQISLRLDTPDGPLSETIVENGLGQIVEEKTLGGNGKWITSRHFYNKNGLPIRKNETGKAPVIQTYDGFGQLERETLWLDETRPIDTSKDRVKEKSWSYTQASITDLGIDNTPMLNVEETSYSAEGTPIIQKEQRALVPSYSTVKSCRLDRFAVSTDKRGNKTLTWRENHDGNKLNVMKWPGAEQLQSQLVIDGKIIADKGRDGIRRHFNYEFSAAGEKTIYTDGRGNTHIETFNLQGDKLSLTENGETTSFVYDNATGLLKHVMQADGTAVKYAYDIRGRKIKESGTASYPIRYEYDEENRLAKMRTYRAEPTSTEWGEGDATQWIYDTASGLLLEKRYPDGHGPVYEYDDQGRVARVLNGRSGNRADYSYAPQTGEISSITYSDGTPAYECEYNHWGQPESVRDASGTRTFRYNSLGEEEGEETQLAQTGVNSTLTYTRDTFGRLNGHTLSMNGTLIHSENLGFDQADRVTSQQLDNGTRHTFTYRQDRGWLDTLNYSSGMRKKMVYDEDRDEIAETGYYWRTQNIPLSRRSVTRDSLGRLRTQTEQRKDQQNRIHEYEYNLRGELTDNLVTGRESRHESYGYDAIGNRLFKGADTTYQSNRLNQYTHIDETNPVSGAPANRFEPTYDLDGNQTGVRTATGEWQVEYNAENRPVCFIQGNRRILCQYDYMGRRTMKSVYDGTNLTERKSFLYKGFLQIAELDTTHSGTGQASQPRVLRTTWWDPTEETETRPLTMALWNSGNKTYYDYTHTLNKDVSELVDANGNIQAAYDYDPFGNIVSQNGPLAGQNFFRHSSEYHDEELGLVYYNYRHYNPRDGRWIGRDPIEESGGLNLYAFLQNQAVIGTDFLGYILHWHHMVPLEAYNKFRKKFPSGFDPNGKENGRMLDDTDHTRKGGIHPEGWNRDWNKWAKEKKTITQEDIAEKNKEMMNKYPKQFSDSKPADKSYNKRKNANKRVAKKAGEDIGEKAIKICGKKAVSSVPVVGWAISAGFMINDLSDPDIPWQDAIGSNMPYVGMAYDGLNYLLDDYTPPNAFEQRPIQAAPFYDNAAPFLNLGGL